MPLSNSTPSDYVVFTTWRTGSSWLMDRLNNVPGVQGHLEIFNPMPRRAPPKAGCNDYPRYVEHDRKGIRPWSVFEYLDGLYSRKEAIGFKLMYEHLAAYPEILWFIATRRLRVIHLVRNNHLDVVISSQLASTSGTWHMTREESRKESRVVSLEPSEVTSHIARLRYKQAIARTTLKCLPNAMHEVSYEDLCHDNNAFLEMCDFIDAPGELEDREHSHLVKTQRSPHSAVISNYQEVRTALTLAGYQHLLQ